MQIFLKFESFYGLPFLLDEWAKLEAKVKERKMKNISILPSETLLDLYRRAKTYWTILIFLLFFTPSGTFAEDKKPADDKKPIGKVITATGSVKAKEADQTERPLKRGDPIYLLESILTEAASKVQLKFSDGGLVNLIAQTEYKVESYVFKEAGKKSEAVSSLVKGGFRVLSGKIAKENPTGVQIRTAVATMGLRGTVGIGHLDETGRHLSAECDSGVIEVSTPYGTVNIGTGFDPYATVAEGEAPVATPIMPEDLVALATEAAFDIEGAEPLEEGQTEEEGQPTEEGEGEGEGEGEETEDEEPLSEDSEEEGTEDEDEDLSEEPEAEESEEEPGEEIEESEAESEAETPEEESTAEEFEGEITPEGEEAGQTPEGEEAGTAPEGEEAGTASESEEESNPTLSGEAEEEEATKSAGGGEEGEQAKSPAAEEESSESSATSSSADSAGGEGGSAEEE